MGARLGNEHIPPRGGVQTHPPQDGRGLSYERLPGRAPAAGSTSAVGREHQGLGLYSVG
jgi:hypothetical protein